VMQEVTWRPPATRGALMCSAAVQKR